jgi:hypothetical protein
VAQAAPATANPMPAQTAARGRRPCPAAISPCQIGWVATSAVAVATEPSWTLGIQVAKWAASANPARTQKIRSRRAAVRSSARRGPSVTGVNAAAAKPFRQNARARAGAAAYAIRGADDETASTAMISAAPVSNPGRWRFERIFIPGRRFLQTRAGTVREPRLSRK